MSKKILLALVAVVVVAGGVAALSAYEAHVINVTAHIENALYVHPDEIAFGTVFPQEYTANDFTVELSTSFKAQGRLDDVTYEIRQKPKPIWPVPAECVHLASGATTIDEARVYCHDNPEDLKCCYLSLCPFLSKLDGDPEDNNDTEVPSYYVPAGVEPAHCITPSPEYATGKLTIAGGDPSDLWKVDLKVPPVSGYVGQDWPAGCPVVAENDKDYGCDLWVEVTGFSPAY